MKIYEVEGMGECVKLSKNLYIQFNGNKIGKKFLLVPLDSPLWQKSGITCVDESKMLGCIKELTVVCHDKKTP